MGNWSVAVSYTHLFSFEDNSHTTFLSWWLPSTFSTSPKSFSSYVLSLQALCGMFLVWEYFSRLFPIISIISLFLYYHSPVVIVPNKQSLFRCFLPTSVYNNPLLSLTYVRLCCFNLVVKFFVIFLCLFSCRCLHSLHVINTRVSWNLREATPVL